MTVFLVAFSEIINKAGLSQTLDQLSLLPPQAVFYLFISCLITLYHLQRVYVRIHTHTQCKEINFCYCIFKNI